MSLEDKFYPDDGSYLTRFDNFMIKAAKEVGVLYQLLTGDSYKNLASIIYKASAVGFGLSALCGHLGVIPLGTDAFSSSKQHSYQTPLEEENKFEAKKITIEDLSKTKINNISLPKKWIGPDIKSLEIGQNIILVGLSNEDKFDIRSILVVE